MVDISKVDLVVRAREVILREAQGIQALADQLDVGLADVIDLLLKCRGHVLVTGAGTSHAMAQRFAHLLSCSGTPALCINAADSLHGGAGAITADDVVFIISKGGRSAEVNQFADIAHARGQRSSPKPRIQDRRWAGSATPFSGSRPLATWTPMA